MELLIGDKLWSSWSLRPWLALKRSGQPFTETLIRLRREDTGDQARAAGSPTGQIPVLRDGAVTIWDSLAICEYLADKFPQARLWPADPVARALGRVSEMLLADELSLGLAPLIVDRLLAALRTAVDERGVGVILVEQHVRKALAVADRVYVMERGNIVMSGTAAEAKAQLSEIEAAYLSHVG